MIVKTDCETDGALHSTNSDPALVRGAAIKAESPHYPRLELFWITQHRGRVQLQSVGVFNARGRMSEWSICLWWCDCCPLPTWLCTHMSPTPPLKGRTFQLPCAEDLSSAGSNRARISLDIGNWKIFWWRIADFSHFLEIFLKKIWKKISKKFFFFTKICFSELEKAYVQLFVLNFFFV